MIRETISLTLMASFATAQVPEVKEDLLRFTNGDQLHGSFGGMAEGPRVTWKRADVDAPIGVEPTQIRQIVLSGGRPEKSLPSLAHAGLVNGDRIPGVLKSLDEKWVVIETAFAGDLRIPRSQVGMIAPSPLGGRLIYHGPFAEDEWSMITAAAPDGLEKEPGFEAKSVEDPARWEFAGSAWYWQATKPGTALVRKEGMPDRAVLRFTAAWRSRMSLAIAFHADFKRPAVKKADPPGVQAAQQFPSADPSFFPRLFGNSYVIQLNGNNVMLYRAGFDETGKSTLDAVRAANYTTRFAESGSAVVELRCNRQSGEISLFINDEFVSQWSEGGEMPTESIYAGKGSGFGFLVQGHGTPVRVSEIAMAEWNGMPDSARSLQTDGRDIVLLANGTDRFSGTVTGFKDGAILLEGKYGGFRFPLDDLAEIRFARDLLAKPPEVSGNDMTIHFHPLGRITGKPLAGGRDSLGLLTTAAGELGVKLDSAVILDFNPSNSFLDDWDVQF